MVLQASLLELEGTTCLSTCRGALWVTCPSTFPPGGTGSWCWSSGFTHCTTIAPLSCLAANHQPLVLCKTYGIMDSQGIGRGFVYGYTSVPSPMFRYNSLCVQHYPAVLLLLCACVLWLVLGFSNKKTHSMLWCFVEQSLHKCSIMCSGVDKARCDKPGVCHISSTEIPSVALV